LRQCLGLICCMTHTRTRGKTSPEASPLLPSRDLLFRPSKLPRGDVLKFSLILDFWIACCHLKLRWLDCQPLAMSVGALPLKKLRSVAFA
jgi:hypothetical protein